MSANPGPPPSALQYHTPVSPRRPGILTAVGILSIVVAAISGLYGAGGVFMGVAFYAASKTMAISTTTTTTVSGTATFTTATLSTTAPTTTAPTTAAVGVNPFQVDVGTMLLSVSTALLSLGAAIVLMIAGIQLLRDAPSSRRLHWTFVMAKIPVAIIAAAAQWMWYSSMFNGMNATTPGGVATPGMASWIMIIPTLITMAVSLAYPFALVFVLKSRTARQYFDSLVPVPVS